METVRIGCVKYLNTLPLIQGVSSWRDAEIVAAVPSRLIDLLLEGEGGKAGVDLALCSTIDFARSPEPLLLVPVGMIGCDGPTLTVRLFSAVPPERITAVHADTDSHTSVALARIILDRMYGVRPQMIDFDARERFALSGASAGAAAHAEWPETVLLIGDKVVTDSPPAVRYPHQLDLGVAWKQLTGLPFVYATWMCREAAMADPGPAQRIRAAAAVLDRARRHNATRQDWLIAAHAGERSWPTDLAARYVGSYLRYEVTDTERAAVQRFFDEAAALALAPRTQARWAEI